MPYNQEIEKRITNVISGWKNTELKKMFGGICYLLNGNMVGGVYKDYLILRLGGEMAVQVRKDKHVRDFDITGRPMKGWVMVAQDGFTRDEELRDWLAKAKEFVDTLPPK